MTTEGPSFSHSSRRTCSKSFMSKGSTTRTEGTPMAWQSLTTSSCGAISPRTFWPVVGLGWWPVMPVVELSTMMTVELPWL